MPFWRCLALHLLPAEKLQLLAQAALELDIQPKSTASVYIYISLIIGKVSKGHNTHAKGMHLYV